MAMGFEEMMTNAYVENRSALLQLYCMTTLTTCTFLSAPVLVAWLSAHCLHTHDFTATTL